MWLFDDLRLHQRKTTQLLVREESRATRWDGQNTSVVVEKVFQAGDKQPLDAQIQT